MLGCGNREERRFRFMGLFCFYPQCLSKILGYDGIDQVYSNLHSRAECKRSVEGSRRHGPGVHDGTKQD